MKGEEKRSGREVGEGKWRSNGSKRQINERAEGEWG